MPVSLSSISFIFRLHPSSLPVKTCSRERRISVLICRLYNSPDTIEHCFIFIQAPFSSETCLLQRVLKKKSFFSYIFIRFLPVPREESIAYDKYVLLNLHNLRRCRMIHYNAESRAMMSTFVEMVSLIKGVVKQHERSSDLLPLLNRC